MPEKIITATLHNLSPVPNGSIYQGAGMFEFVAETGTVLKEIPVVSEKGEVTLEVREVAMAEPYNIEKKYAEYDPELKLYYKDPAIKVELASDVMVAEAEKTEIIEKADKELDAYIADKEAEVIDIKPTEVKPK
jgi:hypothetical protein